MQPGPAWRLLWEPIGVPSGCVQIHKCLAGTHFAADRQVLPLGLPAQGAAPDPLSLVEAVCFLRHLPVRPAVALGRNALTKAEDLAAIGADRVAGIARLCAGGRYGLLLNGEVMTLSLIHI